MQVINSTWLPLLCCLWWRCVFTNTLSGKQNLYGFIRFMFFMSCAYHNYTLMPFKRKPAPATIDTVAKCLAMFDCRIINFPLFLYCSFLALLNWALNRAWQITRRENKRNPIRLLWNKIMHNENERNYIHLFKRHWRPNTFKQLLSNDITHSNWHWEGVSSIYWK